MRKLLGRNGLPDDRTVTEYFCEDGKLIRALLGEEEKINPCEAVEKLKYDLVVYDWYYREFQTDSDQKRAEITGRTIETIMDEFREAAA